jgi:TRAP transporter 4TM/12TM fusion protein
MMALGVVAFIFYLFNVTIGDFVLEAIPYYYILYLMFCPVAFLIMAARKKDKGHVPWYDYVLAAITFIVFLYFLINSDAISRVGWSRVPNTTALVMAILASVLSIEGGRRLGGLPFVIICLIFLIYPMVADQLPDLIWGVSTSWQNVLGSFAYGQSGLLGLPAQTTGDILVGYLIFSGVLTGCGAGDFFIKVSLALLGRYRGGPAKVCVVASALFGTLTGSAVAEIASVGTITISTMKRIGYPAHYAAAIEAVAANGGAIMPPVMGAIAFIMAVITGIPYSAIVIAATIPAILYYWGLLIQVDGYAVKSKLTGLPKEELPSLRSSLKQGWPFIIGIVALVVGLVYLQWGVKSAIYSGILLILLSYINRETRMTGRKLLDVLVNTGSQIVQVMSLLMPVGFILIGFEMTGTLTRLTAAIVNVAGSSVIWVLLIAMFISFVFGMIGISFVSYLILSVVAIPAVVAATGMNVIGLHFFMIWWLLVGAINPPVAILAFIAAAVADAPPMKTAWTATRLAAVTYFVPFFFVYQPALLMEGEPWLIAYSTLTALLGTGILCYGLEGYFPKVGPLKMWVRVLIIAGGFLIALPEWMTTIGGAALCAVVLVLVNYMNRKNHVSIV